MSRQLSDEERAGLTMQELFCVEAENQTGALTSGLLELEQLITAQREGRTSASGAADPAAVLDSLMRAAHSLKGAARILNLDPAVRLAHAMEDCFVAAQHGRLTLRHDIIDVLLRGVDLFTDLSKRKGADFAAWEEEQGAEIQTFLDSLVAAMRGADDGTKSSTAPVTAPRDSPTTPTGGSRPASGISPDRPPAAESRDAIGCQPPSANAGAKIETASAEAAAAESGLQHAAAASPAAADRVLRLTAENLNRLLGLAGESLVESRWLRPFSDSMQRLKRLHAELEDALRQAPASAEPGAGIASAAIFPASDERGSAPASAWLDTARRHAAEIRQCLAERLQELDWHDRRAAQLSSGLYLEVLRTRMRPFADGTQRFPRMVRDLARSLGKQVRLEIIGGSTQVDRDILERLETPLTHLLRNAVDHGCEAPDARRRAGKPAEAVIQLEARHVAGMLQVVVADDGAGLDVGKLRETVVRRKLTTPAVAEKMSDTELLEFLFLPGFTLRNQVTEISGRGVGLDVVQSMVKSVRGTVRVLTQPGRGMKFQLQLPLTLSVLRTLLVEIGGEPYAIPLARIAHTLKLPPERVETLEGRPHFRFGARPVGLLTAQEVLECPAAPRAVAAADLSVVLLGDRGADGFRGYGLVVDRFLGERELVVQPLDPRLGKVRDINAAALMEDGTPVLILDVDDLLRSIENLLASGGLAEGSRALGRLEAPARKRKRVLVVDDSLTVRELERKLLAGRGYLADVAVDGMDGWNAVRRGVYDLVITDVDMPRLDGIELARLIKQDAQFKLLPVMIVSYKDREADRLRGLEAGADYYLTKGSFHDERLLEAVADLIGDPEA